MLPVIVTARAIARYVERLGGTKEEAAAALSGRPIQIAAEFGAPVVRFPNARVVMRFDAGTAVVLTVVPPNYIPHQLMPLSWGGPPLSRDDRAPLPQPMETANG